MTVGELIEKLDLIDRECEVLIIDSHLEVNSIEKVGLDPYFDHMVDNNKTPLCIRVY